MNNRIQQKRTETVNGYQSQRQSSADRISTVSGPTASSLRSMNVRTASRDDVESVRSTRSKRTVASIDPVATSVRDAPLRLDPIDEWDMHKEPAEPEPRRIHLRQHLALGITELVLAALVFFLAVGNLAQPPGADMMQLATGVWLGPCLAVAAMLCILLRMKNTYRWAAVCFYALCVAVPLCFVGLLIECVEVAFVDTRYKMLREDWNINRAKVCVSCTEYALSKSGLTIFFLFVELLLFGVSLALSHIDAGITCCKLKLLQETQNVETVYVTKTVYVEVPENTLSNYDATSVTAPSIATQSQHSVPHSRGTMSIISDISGRGGPPRSISQHLNN